MIACRLEEHAFDPSLGNVGRGTAIPWDEFTTLTGLSGYEPYIVLGSEKRGVQVYSTDGTPTSRVWKGFARQDAATGLYYIVGFESDTPKGE